MTLPARPHLPLILLAALLPVAVEARERQLTGPEILALLPGIIAHGDASVQSFSAGGPTRYEVAGRPSTGRWWTTQTQYCSNWPPAALNACYDVFLDDSTDPALLIWVGASGARTVNWIEERP